MDSLRKLGQSSPCTRRPQVKKTVALILGSLLLASCGDPLFKMINSDEPYHQDIDYHPKTFAEAWQWVSTNISYQKDPSGGYKKHPEETYKDRCGDCEDFSLLLAYFGAMLGENVTIVVCHVDGVEGLHTICRYKGALIEPQTYQKYYNKNRVHIKNEMTYPVAYFTTTLREVCYESN